MPKAAAVLLAQPRNHARKTLGGSVGADVAVVTTEESAQNIEQELQKAAQSESKLVARVSMQEEVNRARKLQEKSKAAITSMFLEARMGTAINAADAEPIKSFSLRGCY